MPPRKKRTASPPQPEHPMAAVVAQALVEALGNSRTIVVIMGAIREGGTDEEKSVVRAVCPVIYDNI